MGEPTYTAWRDFREEGRADGFTRYPDGSAERNEYLSAVAIIEEMERRSVEDQNMGLMVKDNGKDFEIAPAGLHLAVCYSLIDCGLQTDVFDGKERKKTENPDCLGIVA